MIPRFADHAANERTFLAWVRSVVAIDGFGIAAARLGDTPPAPWSEPAMLGLGALVILLSFARMRALRRRIDTAAPDADGGTAGDALLLVLATALFALVAVFTLHLG